VPVGRLIDRQKTPTPQDPIQGEKQEKDGSIIVIVATDAPLLPFQCKRLAQRATVGLSQVGGYGHNSSGDIFLAFATGNDLHFDNADVPVIAQNQPLPVQMLPNHCMDPLFHATAEATAESILNALCAAETMTGYKGRTVHALPTDELQQIWQQTGNRL
jgi:D-aminopeptidase